ncbi:endonuclease/exonuclease/phosphatase family protein [Actinoplanes couchii]|uniref:Endonuclease n=1 Tax=Actinoplanes couchii TaxID=403638 RepID=A0ABQ3X5N7_9ACTN|nr:endonuclease/exonuclease/phosphatase family protein [Actinoplanes couchii]MDR6325490.1 endonuclease/exonuclease/phosphatase family metal-dependent hydrolase [Actinoplanes couchii]GID53809.1 endonuclease [Actinoplanes couchii]
MTITESPAVARPRRRGRVVWTVLLWLSVVPAAVWLVGRTFGWEAGPSVQLLAFTPYVAIWTLVPLFLALVTQRWAAAAVAALVSLGFGMAVVPRGVVDGDKGPATGVELRVMTANLLFSSAEMSEVVRLVRENRVDVLAVQEFTPNGEAALRAEGLEALLPYHQLAPEFGASGSGLYSRFPFAEQAARRNDGGFQQAHATVQVPGAGAVYIESVHPLAPHSMDVVSGWSTDLREQVPAAGGIPKILMGDFNATLDHKQLRDVIATGYRDAAAAVGKGWIGTWGPYDGDPIPPVTIDHVLADERIGVKDLYVLVLQDSDHHALVAELTVPAA